MRRYRPRRRRMPQNIRRPLSRGERLLLRVSALFLLLLLSVWGLNLQLRPIVTSMAVSQVNNLATHIIDEIIYEQAAAQSLTYDSIITLEKDVNGYVTALKTDMNEVNRVRTQIVNAVIAGLQSMETKEIGVPVGSLTGIAVFSGRGPEIPVKVLSTGSVSSQFANSFQAASISQTRHSIVLEVKASLTVLLPGHRLESTVTSGVNVAETIIVGNVPDSYTYFSQFDSAWDAAEIYNDYGPGANDRLDNSQG